MRGSRTKAVVEAIQSRVAQRLLTPGDRLPSIRGLAKTMGISPSTVVEAYERLAADGLVQARPGSGFYLSGASPSFTLADDEPKREHAIDPFWITRQSLDGDANLAKPGCGWLPADWLPGDSIRRALRAIARADNALLCDYGPTRGLLSLRRLLSRQLGERGLSVPPEQILLTESGTRAIDLICRLFLQPGDTVLVDDPCYFNFRALLKAHRANIVGIPYTANGPDVSAFTDAAATHRPRLYVTNSAVQNPTGASLSAPIAHRVLSAATAHGVTIIEDDIYADFEPEPSPRFATLDGLAQVIRISSFSKTLSSSIRCGYIAARADLVDALVDLQVATNVSGPSPLAADLVGRALLDVGYRKHLVGLRHRLTRVRRDVTTKLEALGIEPLLAPRGGFHLWCKLPGGRQARTVARAALREEVMLAPGDVFSTARSASSFMRFNVAHMFDRRVYSVLERALRPSATGE